MKTMIVLYGCAALVFITVDLTWLAIVARDFYKSQLQEFLLPAPRWGAALAFYAIYPAGIVAFAMLPAAAAGSWGVALIQGALFGFVAYCTYDLTNLAMARGYSTTVALVDIAWGTLVTAAAATLGYLITRVVSDI